MSEKKEITQEELIAAWKKYYENVDLVYPTKSFTLKSKSGETLNFYHGFNVSFGEIDDDEQTLCYILRDSEFEEAYRIQKAEDLSGQKRTGQSASEKYKSKAFIDIRKKEKVFNFGVDWDYQYRGYGQAIYYNYLEIMQMLGIERN